MLVKPFSRIPEEAQGPSGATSGQTHYEKPSTDHLRKSPSFALTTKESMEEQRIRQITTEKILEVQLFIESGVCNSVLIIFCHEDLADVLPQALFKGMESS